MPIKRTEQTPHISSADNKKLMEEFYESYNQYVYKLAWQRCCNVQEVEDVVQKTWLSLFTKAELLRTLSVPKQMSYISVTLTNVIRLDAREKKAAFCSLDGISDVPYDGAAMLESITARRIKILSFRKIWSSVDGTSRELLERKYVLLETDEEIAAKLNIKASSVRMYLSRARRAALKVLQEHKDDLL